MGQKAAKPLPPWQQEREQEEQPPGLIPRSTLARAACNTRRVRRLIRAGRLGACWMPLADGQGIECPVCMELYARLNHTACCHQDICTECFISIVAPGGAAAARCPYCQARSLQVYLPPPSSACLAAAPHGAGAPGSAAQAAAAARTACCLPPQPAAAGAEGQLLLHLDRIADGSSHASSASAHGALTDVVLVGALSSGRPASAATATVAAAAEVAAGPARAGPACRRHKACSAGGASPPPLLAVAGPLARRSQLEALAEAAGAASRRQSLTVGMVVVAAPGSPAAAGPSSVGAGSSAAPGDTQGLEALPASEAAGSSPLVGAAAAAGAAPGSWAATCGAVAGGAADGAAGGAAAVETAAGRDAPVSLAGCPALLVNPDGTEQLVLLSSGQPAAGTTAGGPARAPTGMPAEPAVPSYQAPSNPEDSRMREAIARADAALLRPLRPAGAARPPSGARRGGDWLEQLRRADAALRAAVAANDQQRFGGAAGGGGSDAGG